MPFIRNRRRFLVLAFKTFLNLDEAYTIACLPSPDNPKYANILLPGNQSYSIFHKEKHRMQANAKKKPEAAAMVEE